MSQPDDPYRSPAAAIEEAKPLGIARVYSPRQAGFGGLVGGPLGGAYFLWANFMALGMYERAAVTVRLGSVVAIALVVGSLFVPGPLGYGLWAVNFLVPYLLVPTLQMDKAAIEASPDHELQSNWKTLGMALLWFCVWALVYFIAQDLLVLAGIRG
jgi:hypothetical protein